MVKLNWLCASDAIYGGEGRIRMSSKSGLLWGGYRTAIETVCCWPFTLWRSTVALCGGSNDAWRSAWRDLANEGIVWYVSLSLFNIGWVKAVIHCLIIQSIIASSMQTIRYIRSSMQCGRGSALTQEAYLITWEGSVAIIKIRRRLALHYHTF